MLLNVGDKCVSDPYTVNIAFNKKWPYFILFIINTLKVNSTNSYRLRLHALYPRPSSNLNQINRFVEQNPRSQDMYVIKNDYQKNVFFSIYTNVKPNRKSKIEKIIELELLENRINRISRKNWKSKINNKKKGLK